jgi:N-acetylglucosamine-6-phosphate deacetylase
MSTLRIRNAEVVLSGDTVLSNHSVYCINGKIDSINPSSEKDPRPADETVDASGCYLAPGFIDLHIHGTLGYAVHKGMDDVKALTKALPQFGVTGFLPTVTPFLDPDKDIEFLQSLKNLKTEGTEILGCFLEGHFLALTGAIANIPKNRTKERVEELIEAAFPCKLVFGVSPEVEGIDKLIPIMTNQGYPVFITHTAATAEQTLKVIAAGPAHATHFYNVFPYMGDKEGGCRGCGTVEAIMASPEVGVDFIFDGEHVDPLVATMAIACKGLDKVCVISDANVNAGLPVGRYSGLDNTEIVVLHEGGPARMADGPHKGGLVGSGLTMDKAVRNAVDLLGLDVAHAVAVGSSSPARVLGLADHKGYIKAGYDADMVLLDKDLHVSACWVGQKCCFSK